MAKKQPKYDNNVSKLKKNAYSYISCFLETKALNSTNTASSYEADIKQFFRAVRYKALEMLTIEDLIITVDDVEAYQLQLAKNNDIAYNDGKPYAPSSIARKISSVKKLYSRLEAKDLPVKEAWFNVDKIKGESESYGVLSWEEVLDMIELVKDEKKGDIKASLMETAVITCFRQNSLLNLTWDNIENIDGVWVLCAEEEAIGKGKQISKKPITDELHDRLMGLKKKHKDRRIFPLEKKTVVVMMQRLRGKLKLDDDITFHSLKKCGINEAYEISGGDIMAVAEQGDHKSFGTTMKHYMKKKKKFSEMVGLKIGQKVDISSLENLTQEQLMKLVQQSSRNVQIELMNNLKKIQL